MLTDLQRIEHMIENAELLLSFSTDITKVEYASSVEKQYSMKFAFVMLGEDAASISEELKLKYPSIPWQSIKGMRTIIAHDYNKTDKEFIWDAVIKEMEPLRQKLLQIKSELEKNI